ncbi:hypothetical protein [Planctomicrobium sp. SH527]|uniref:hypothetical protein n=1 Tax=Planctomicrobium sp. SH527 TaxID=3448123 RepID=UPI003F5B6D7A
MSSEIVHQLARIATALESGTVKNTAHTDHGDSEALRNVQAIGWLFYLREKNGKASKADVARAMGYSNHSALRHLSTFSVVFDRMRIVDTATTKGGSSRRNGRTNYDDNESDE